MPRKNMDKVTLYYMYYINRGCKYNRVFDTWNITNMLGDMWWVVCSGSNNLNESFDMTSDIATTSLTALLFAWPEYLYNSIFQS